MQNKIEINWIQSEKKIPNKLNWERSGRIWRKEKKCRKATREFKLKQFKYERGKMLESQNTMPETNRSLSFQYWFAFILLLVSEKIVTETKKWRVRAEGEREGEENVANGEYTFREKPTEK